MVKRFAVWVEEMENQIQKKKELMNSLLDRLDLNKNSLNNNDIMINDIKLSKIIDSINSLPTTEENKHAMITFAQQNYKSLSLKALANKINVNDAETQDKTSSMPATLPQGNQPAPKPLQQQQQQNQPQPGIGLQ